MSGREKYCDLPKVDAAVQIEFIFFYTNLLNERMAAIFKENSFIRFFTNLPDFCNSSHIPQNEGHFYVT